MTVSGQMANQHFKKIINTNNFKKLTKFKKKQIFKK